MMSRLRSDPAAMKCSNLSYILSFMAPAGRPLRGGARNDVSKRRPTVRRKGECKMQTQTERQTIPTAQAVFVQGQGGRSPEVKRCGYCDRLVCWTLQEGRNVAVNCDGSRHQCITDRTAKRKQPARHPRPSPDEVAAFLKSGHAATYQEEQLQSEQSSTELSLDAKTKATNDDNNAAWNAQTEAMIYLADAMLKVVHSNNSLADSNRRLANACCGLARVMERAGRIHR